MNKRMRCINVDSGYIELKPKKSYWFAYGDGVDATIFTTFLISQGLPPLGNYNASFSSDLKKYEVILMEIKEEYEFA